MNNRYILFDVETPNFRNNRMSAIGITVVENAKIEKVYYTLVNPECEFDSFNIELTGISPDMVIGQPTFPELWNAIEPIFSNGLIMAHNAPFDMSVLSKCLNDYNIEWKPYVKYACTCAIGKKVFPMLENHKLNTMCDYFNIQLDHHNAASDSSACARLLLHYLNKGTDIHSFARTYDVKKSRTLKKQAKPAPVSHPRRA